jgi:hypothetical protein
VTEFYYQVAEMFPVDGEDAVKVSHVYDNLDDADLVMQALTKAGAVNFEVWVILLKPRVKR